MKKVVSNSEVPHLWMHQTQEEARNSTGSLYFNGKTIYSYGSHFPIARHVENEHGQKAILFTSQGYSVTTSQHKGAVRHAIPSSVTVFEVPNIGRWSTSEPEHKYNLDRYRENITSALNTAARAKKDYSKNYNLSNAENLRLEALEYAKFFNLEITLPEIPHDLSEVKKALYAEQARKAKEEKERKERVKKENAAELESWRKGGYAHYSVLSSVDTMLRVNGNEVETSRGARFPINHAKRGLALVRSVRERKEPWSPNGHTTHLGHYSIDKIEANGTVHAGCHIVKWEEIERIAPQLETL